MDAQTKDLLRDSIREVLAGSKDLRSALVELGWDEVVADDAKAAVTILFTEQGRARAASRLLDTVVVGELGGAIDPAAAVVYPAVDGGAQPTSTIDGERVTVNGLVLGPIGDAPALIVPVAAGDGVELVTVPVGDLTVTPIDGFDPDAGWSSVTGSVTSTGRVGDREAASRALAAAQRAVASEIVGVAQAALTLAVDHVSTRRQFGHTIASFQMVRFRLAEAWTWLSAAEATVDAAWDDRSPEASSLAKAYAGQAHSDAVAHCTQVCGAMGVTYEHDLHRYVRRGFVLDALLGSSLQLSGALGASFLAGAPIPRLVAAAAL
ncbi:MAG TPA: acyl-CoA dehydrogenase family protein [Mycobacteriales bacterium]|nr:acyl-CoA dehydrogenase family protein [Mycobacteriales bacterium]